MSVSGRTSIVENVAFSVAQRWIDRLIGVVSTIVLARLLVPEDFGIIAQAALVMALITVLTDLGVNWALIQNRDASPDHYNTAWTIRLMQSGVVALMILAAAPLAGEYFSEPRTVPVLRVMAAGLVISALGNIGVITFQKEMKFGLDFRYSFIKRISGFVITLGLAFAWRSYWALVIGTLIGIGVGVLLSYHMHPMRPRLSLARFAEIFSFSQWTLVRGIGAYFLNSLDQLLVGGRSSTALMGAYTLAKEISAMPSSELLAPLNRVLFPAFVKAKQNLDELRRLFLLAQGVQTLIVMPASIGLALVANEAVPMLLGEKWMVAVPFVQILALLYVVHAVTTSAGYVIITLGEMRYSAALVWLQLAMFAVAAIALMPQAGAIEIAQLRLLAVTCGLLASLWLLKRVLPNLRLRQVLATNARPLLGSAAMAGAVMSLSPALPSSVLAALLIEILVGAFYYAVAVLAMWALAGRPDGAETYLLGKVKAYWQKGRRARPNGT